MRATASAIAAFAVALALFTGCAASPTGASVGKAPPTPSEIPAPLPTADVDVPRVSSALDLNQVPVPLTPERIRVVSLGIDMPIESVGLAPDGAMRLPANPAVAAWYRYGPSPTSPTGATVVAAHVDSLVYDLGPFARLAKAGAGTEIVVTTEDGLDRRYALESIQTVNKADVPWASIFDRSGPARLTLVTCGGEFDYDARRYLSNVIATARPIP
ncbi:class F sortase [Cryobacterium tagatosivorans]|uniref:Class F sortase n=1 Tax=Cryobacterium tagatosivorans TaxID=1259199 RepID=A0A4R8UGY4_9MICO|nr:class F sortase [Cryobacterium tagatosivorans]TFB52298.1 class F sortase [Cryobacterium tagatosivorans]